MGGEGIATTARGNRKTGGVEDHIGRDETMLQHLDACAVLQTRDVEGLGAYPARGEGIYQRIDGGGLRPFEYRAVEDNGGKRADGICRVAIETSPWQFARGSWGVGAFCQVAAIAEESGGVLRAAHYQILAQALAVRGAQGRSAGQFQVGLRITREDTQLNAAFA